jgi:hypothetical protein
MNLLPQCLARCSCWSSHCSRNGNARTWFGITP